MALRLTKPDSVNVLIEDSDWAWPRAVTEIFQPRGINALLAESTTEAVRLVSNNRIHLAILNYQCDSADRQPASPRKPRPGALGLSMLRLVRKQDSLLPCILLAHSVDDRLLAEALSLGAYSVLAKPVDMNLLGRQINRLFQKWYSSNVFSPPQSDERGPTC